MSIRSFCRSNSRMMFCSAGRFSCLFMPAIARVTPLVSGWVRERGKRDGRGQQGRAA